MKDKIVGIDLGSMFLKYVIIDRNGNLLKTFYKNHFGTPLDILKEELGDQEVSAAITGSHTDLLGSLLHLQPINLVQALVKGAKTYFPDVRNIIDIGANSAHLIELNEAGRFKFSACNSLCAAGTGSFLDEQMERLEFNYDSIKALKLVEEPPRIASRCAVFAKTDLIHRQQEGYTREQVWSGLCRGMTQTCLTSLLKGKKMVGHTVLTGGVSLNSQIIHWLKSEYKDINTFGEAHYAAAIGAAHLALERGKSHKVNFKTLIIPPLEKETYKRKPLELIKTKYPSFEVHKFYKDENATEVRVIKPLDARHKSIDVFIGIDVGSTSTKAVLMDVHKNIIVDVYRKTLGDPLGATKKILVAIKKISEDEGMRFNFIGAGTTGSGRSMVGKILSVDHIVNEITAHATGAMEVDPAIDTIFEIGGQDAKYTRTKNGYAYDSNMNFVCAAGTGSFIEEQAKKLGYSVEEVGSKVLGIEPPITSDRCTVFMEQDIRLFLKRGYSREEVLAATMYSIVQNYLLKVVGNRHVNPHKVFFQGATARNVGLVAAFEKLLDVEIVVSPFCHVMGCYGVSLLLHKKWEAGELKAGQSKFIGYSFIDKNVEMTEEVCKLCTNYCTITHARLEGEEKTVSWGYLCGRDPEERKRKPSDHFKLVELRNKMASAYKKPQDKNAPTIGMPNALGTIGLRPLWDAFFSELGFNVKYSPVTNEQIMSDGINAAGADFCLPAKLSIGHSLHLLNDKSIHHIFMPSVLENFQNKETTRSWFCPLAISQPYYTISAVHDHPDFNKIITTCLNLNWSEKVIVKELMQSLGHKLHKSARQFTKAWRKAVEAQKDYEKKCLEFGKNLIKEICKKDEMYIVLLGRPYNLYDGGANLELPLKITRYNYTVIPLDFIPFDEETRKELIEAHWNMFWHHGQKILNAAEFVRKIPNLYPIYFSNFNCGPDTYVIGFTEKTMGSKPILILELDEHSSDGGYITRIEAYFDAVRSNPVKTSSKYWANMKVHQLHEVDKKTPMYLPGSPDHYPQVAAAVFRGLGYNCQSLPPSTTENYNLGKKYARGSECCPAIAIAGQFLKKIKEEDEGNVTIGMSTACGPCRLGQYVHFYNSIYQEMEDRNITFVTQQIGVAEKDSLSKEAKKEMFRGLVAVDILKKLLYKTRPYEIHTGKSDEVYMKYREKVLEALEQMKKVDPLIVAATREFKAVPVNRDQKRYLVAIVGEYFTKHDPFINQELIKTIEDYGGEAWITPHSEWFIWGSYEDYYEEKKLTPYRLIGVWMKGLLVDWLEKEEKRLMDLTEGYLHDRHEPHMRQIYAAAKEYLSLDVAGGDLVPTIGRGVLYITKDKVAMIVNCKPFSCMPGNNAEAIFQKVQKDYDVPILSIAYEGSGDANRAVRTMLINM